MDSARSGSGRLVLIAGEPGAGKTRLAGLTATAGVPVAHGRAIEPAGSPPYWPFRQILQALGRPGMFGAASAAEERFRRFEAVSAALIDAAEPAGLVLVLDDLHWADPGSLQLLVHLARSLAASRLAVVAAYRTTETAGREPLRAALAELSREPATTRIVLTGLSEAEVGEQLCDIAGWAVPEPVAAAVRRRTGGNPFFVGELGRVLAGAREGDLPEGVRDAVRARLGRLTPPCRSVVAAAAVLGTTEPLDLAAVLELGPAGVLGALDEAAAAGIVAPAPGYDFTHDIIRESAGLDVATAERLRLHARLGGFLAARPGARERAALVAYHLIEAAPLVDAPAATRWAADAAEQAAAQLAWEEAALWYERALRAGGAGESERTDLLIERARAQIKAYDVDGARVSLTGAADSARRRADYPALGRAVLVMEGVTDFIWERAGRALCEEALAGLPDEDSPLRARLLAQLVAADVWTESPASDQRSRAALAMAERLGDKRALIEALRARQLVRGVPDGARDRLELAGRLTEIGRAGDDDAALWAGLWRFDAHVQLGEIDRAEAGLPAVAEAARRLRTPLARWHAVRVRATMDHARGRFADALTHGRQAEALARQAAHDGALTPSVGFLLGLAAITGDAAAVPEEPGSTGFAGVAAEFLRAMFATWKLAHGDRDGAERLYRTLPPLASVPRFVLISALGGTAELAAAFDDREMAAEVHRRLLPWADYFVCGGAGVVLTGGSARMPLGIAAATCGRLDDAAGHLREAVRRNEAAGLPPMAAAARYHLARTLARRRRPGDREEAAALAVAAGAEAEALGMRPLARDAAALLAGLGVAGPLTRREREIAGLAARGLTNRQIAAAAHISERTAESHIQHILTKLGFASRRQIAGWVASGMRTPSP
ncbi:ATP-binding protein [Actinoplanes sp. CA-030573]|uniref:ATP-binding protein n=1 Tax=Actinoplanes sp. CA-030573 TaxID=3239898 RepID=UPI003D8DCAF8